MLVFKLIFKKEGTEKEETRAGIANTIEEAKTIGNKFRGQHKDVWMTVDIKPLEIIESNELLVI